MGFMIYVEGKFWRIFEIMDEENEKKKSVKEDFNFGVLSNWMNVSIF